MSHDTAVEEGLEVGKGGESQEEQREAVVEKQQKDEERMEAGLAEMYRDRRMGKMIKATTGSSGGKMRIMMKMTRSKLRVKEKSGGSLKVTCNKMETAGVGQWTFGRVMKVRKEERWVRW